MRGHLKFMILCMLKEQALSGVDIVEKINKRTGWKPSYGSVYPILESLHKDKHVKIEVQKRKKIYSLTKKGEEKLEELSKKKEEIIDSLIQRHKMIETYLEIDASFEIMFLEEVKRGKTPLIEIQPEIEEMKKELKRLMQKNLKKTQKEELRKTMKEANTQLKAIK